MSFHQQHFHDVFKLCKSYMEQKKITAVENKLRKNSQHTTTTHTHIYFDYNFLPTDGTQYAI